MSARESWKPAWLVAADLNLTSRLSRSCANLLIDHPEDDVCEARGLLERAAGILDDALERVPATVREMVNATLAEHRIDLN